MAGRLSSKLLMKLESDSPLDVEVEPPSTVPQGVVRVSPVEVAALVDVGVARLCNALDTCDIRVDSVDCWDPLVVSDTAAVCRVVPAGSVTSGAGGNCVSCEVSAEFAAYWYIATASCAHISTYSASLAAIAGEFWPRKLVAVNEASWTRFAVTADGGTVIPYAASKTSAASLA